jgi:integrase
VNQRERRAAVDSLIVVSRRLGHANPQITAQVYSHLIDDSQLAAVPDAFEAIFAANSP